MLEGSRHGLPWDHEIRRGHWAKTSSRANPRTDARFPSSTFNKTISGCLQREPAKKGGRGPYTGQLKRRRERQASGFQQRETGVILHHGSSNLGAELSVTRTAGLSGGRRNGP
ncbi:hypothetical protein CGCTS75_v009421 [Colletotrichum tropicale]|nr:hypothetical protein CGCTS75_v009421 [Colletotrichum tropicale]